MTRKKRLGRGLEALLSVTSDPTEESELESVQTESISTTGVVPEVETSETDRTSDTVYLSVYEIDDNPFQPRREFSESEIVSLAESLKEHDILQPILVRIVNGRYQLISGERRLRAAIHANWQTIPARIRRADDRLVAELAIVENLQRKDLNPIEKALSFRRYIDEHGCTQEGLAGRLKIDRSTIANLMRLLELPRGVQDALAAGKISAGHARALLPLGDERLQLEFSQRIQDEGWSVRATEAGVSALIRAEDDPRGKPKKTTRTQNPQIESLERNLKFALGTRVKIKTGNRGKGSIIIDFANNSEFERLNALLSEPQSVKKAA